MRIKLSHSFDRWPLFRQTPGNSGMWGDCQFVRNEVSQPDQVYDAWVVLHGHRPDQTVICPPSRTIHVTFEPPGRIELFNPDYLKQFAAIVTCVPGLDHPQVIHAQQSQPWFVGLAMQGFKLEADQCRLNYDSLSAMADIPKTRLISAMCSDVDRFPSHRQRIEFVRKLQAHFGDEIHVYGRGYRHIEDKWDAIAPYRFHITIENGVHPDYWSEKLADAFLGGAMPIYHGCPNIERYFSPDSMLRIDIRQPAKRAIQAIERAIADKLDQQRHQAVWAARRQVLDEYNFFPMVANLLKQLPPSEPKPVTIRSKYGYPTPAKLKWGYYFWRLYNDPARLCFRLKRKIMDRATHTHGNAG